VTFITSRKEVRTSPLYQDLEKEDPSLFKRLNYAKEILVGMINPSKLKQEVNEENYNPRLSTGLQKFPNSASKKSKERSLATGTFNPSLTTTSRFHQNQSASK
jgi:hypothetical protein